MAACHQLLGRALGEVEKSENLVALHGVAGLGNGWVGVDYLRALERIKTAGQRAGGRRVVGIDDAYGQVLGSTSLHHRREKGNNHDGKHHHAEAVDGVLPQNPHLTNHYCPHQSKTLHDSLHPSLFTLHSSLLTPTSPPATCPGAGPRPSPSGGPSPRTSSGRTGRWP